MTSDGMIRLWRCGTEDLGSGRQSLLKRTLKFQIGLRGLLMFHFENGQKVCEIGGVKFGGQPGEYPTVIVASIF